LIIHDSDPAFTKILWTDEATFKTRGRENHYNCVTGVTSTYSKWQKKSKMFQDWQSGKQVGRAVTGPLKALSERRIDELSCSNLCIVGVNMFMKYW